MPGFLATTISFQSKTFPPPNHLKYTPEISYIDTKNGYISKENTFSKPSFLVVFGGIRRGIPKSWRLLPKKNRSTETWDDRQRDPYYEHHDDRHEYDHHYDDHHYDDHHYDDHRHHHDDRYDHH